MVILSIRRTVGVLRRAIPGLCLVLVGVSTALAAVVPRLSFGELVSGAERIVHARCLVKDAYLEPASGMIWTRYEFEIVESLKGGQESRIVITEPGGRYGNRGQWAPGAPQFETGDEVVLFLARTATGKWRVYGLGQGNFRIQRDSVSGAAFVQADMSGIELVEMPGAPGQMPQVLPRAVPGTETVDQLKQRIREQVVKKVLQR